MAWRIAKHVVRGVIDNRIRGKITGTFWLADWAEPVQVQLKGSTWPDMAGRVLTFSNPNPQPGIEAGFSVLQSGVCGDMTASRKVKVPEIPVEEVLSRREPFPFHWANELYLEWFSAANGRVIIASHQFELHLSEPAWVWTPDLDRRQKAEAGKVLGEFLNRMRPLLESVDDPWSAPAGEDPLDLRAIDCRLRINELKHQVEKLAGGQMVHGSAPGLPPEVEEQFWRNVLEFESAPVLVRREMLARDGVVVRPSVQVQDNELKEELWALIYALAHRRTFLGHTNHLSDRALYRLLVEEVLEEETTVLPPHSGWACCVWLDEYGAQDDADGHLVFLRFYADEVYRQEWLEDFPQDQLPPREEPPYDRDSQLPREEGMG